METEKFKLIKRNFLIYCKKRIQEELGDETKNVLVFEDLADYAKSLPFEDLMKLSTIYKEAFNKKII